MSETAPIANLYTVQLECSSNRSVVYYPDGDKSRCASVWDYEPGRSDVSIVMLWQPGPGVPGVLAKCATRAEADAIADLHARMCARVMAAEAAQ